MPSSHSGLSRAVVAAVLVLLVNVSFIAAPPSTGPAGAASACQWANPPGGIPAVGAPAVDVDSDVPVDASGTSPVGGTPNGGYTMVASDGTIYAFGPAAKGSISDFRLTKPIVDIAGTPSGNGYWLVAADGGIFTFGDARYYGSLGNLRLNRPIVGMAATPSGNGYWLVAADGGIFTFGDARFLGSTGGIVLNKPIVGMAATPSGNGYWLVASDGGIFTYGDATFLGSTGAIQLQQRIAGMASTASGRGYWLVAADGGIFAFGEAAFLGSTGNLHLVQPIVGMAATASGAGYWLVAADGGVFTFGDAAFKGSMGSSLLDGRIVGLMPQGGDVRAPVLRHLSFGPKVVDTSGGEAVIRFRANITDDMAGFSLPGKNGMSWIGGGTAEFVGPGGVHFGAAFNRDNRVHGDALDGIYKTIVCLPAHSPAGTWTVNNVWLRDAVGNETNIPGTTLAQAGFPTSFEQISAGDTELPRLWSLSMSTTTVDTSAAPATIHLTAHVTDNDTGVAYVGVTFSTGPVNQVISLPTALWLRSGTINDGIFEGDLVVPRYYRRGFWALSSVFLRDSAGNMGNVPPNELAAVGGPAGFSQTGADDTTSPQIRSVTMTPGEVDTSTGPATVTVTVRASDDLSGLFVDGVAAGSQNMVTLISPSQQRATALLELTSGTDKDGTLVAHVTLPLHSEQGTWTLQWVTVLDRAGNWAPQLPGPPATVDVTRTGG